MELNLCTERKILQTLLAFNLVVILRLISNMCMYHNDWHFEVNVSKYMKSELYKITGTVYIAMVTSINICNENFSYKNNHR